MNRIYFDVFDTITGETADIEQIALKEEWAQDLVYCDMEGWMLDQDGNLSLHDECGGIAYPPDPERFVVHMFEGERPSGPAMTPEQINEWINKHIARVDKSEE